MAATGGRELKSPEERLEGRAASTDSEGTCVVRAAGVESPESSILNHPTLTMILIGKLDELNAHSRFIVSLRSISLESKYHSIVIYGVDKEHPTPIGSDVDADTALATRSPDSVALASHTREWHAMEEECPHLGASMAEAEIEIEDDGVIAICPWHKRIFFGLDGMCPTNSGERGQPLYRTSNRSHRLDAHFSTTRLPTIRDT